MDKVSERAILERARHRQPRSCDRVKGRETEQRGGVGRRLRHLAGGWSDCRYRFPEAASGASASISALINAQFYALSIGPVILPLPGAMG